MNYCRLSMPANGHYNFIYVHERKNVTGFKQSISYTKVLDQTQQQNKDDVPYVYLK